MDTISIVCIILLTFIIGAIVGLSIRPKASPPPPLVGTLIVDPKDQLQAVGVYSQFDQDPKTFTDGSVISLQVMVLELEELHNVMDELP